MIDIQEFSCLSFLLSFCYNSQSENLEISNVIEGDTDEALFEAEDLPLMHFQRAGK